MKQKKKSIIQRKEGNEEERREGRKEENKEGTHKTLIYIKKKT